VAEGFSEIVGLEPGSYDKQRDFRLPDRGRSSTPSRQNHLAGRRRATWCLGRGHAVAQEASGPGLFAVFSRHQHLRSIDFEGRRGAIQLPVPLRYYDPHTLQEQEDFAGGSLLFSLATDPLHAEALARRKKDPAFLDLYWAGLPPGRTTGPTGKAPLDVADRSACCGRPWTIDPSPGMAAGGHAAVLRKHKNFSRGGNLLEVYLLERAAPKL
jgi:hypothetical protein